MGSSFGFQSCGRESKEMGMWRVIGFERILDFVRGRCPLVSPNKGCPTRSADTPGPAFLADRLSIGFLTEESYPFVWEGWSSPMLCLGSGQLECCSLGRCSRDILRLLAVVWLVLLFCRAKSPLARVWQRRRPRVLGIG